MLDRLTPGSAALSEALAAARALLKSTGRLWLFERHAAFAAPLPGSGAGALARLRQKLDEAGFACERTLYSTAACNWEDLRDNIKDRLSLASWCHGAPGVSLSRIGALKLVTETEWQEPLRADLNLGLKRLTACELRTSTRAGLRAGWRRREDQTG